MALYDDCILSNELVSSCPEYTPLEGSNPSLIWKSNPIEPPSPFHSMVIVHRFHCGVEKGDPRSQNQCTAPDDVWCMQIYNSVPVFDGCEEVYACVCVCLTKCKRAIESIWKFLASEAEHGVHMLFDVEIIFQKDFPIHFFNSSTCHVGSDCFPHRCRFDGKIFHYKFCAMFTWNWCTTCFISSHLWFSHAIGWLPISISNLVMSPTPSHWWISPHVNQATYEYPSSQC